MPIITETENAPQQMKDVDSENIVAKTADELYDLTSHGFYDSVVNYVAYRSIKTGDLPFSEFLEYQQRSQTDLVDVLDDDNEED